MSNPEKILGLFFITAFFMTACSVDHKSNESQASGPRPPVSTNALKVNDDTSGQHANQRTAFNSAGTSGVAVWDVYNGQSYRVLSSVYSGGTWADEVELAQNAFSPSVAAVGTGFMVVYSGGGSIYARLYNGTAWGTETVIDSSSYYGYSPVIASGGSTCAAAWPSWNGSSYDIYASIYNGSWGTEELLESDSGNADYPVIVSASSSGYAMAWLQYDGSIDRLYASIYNGSWGTPALIDNGSYAAYEPSIASNGSGYAAIWSQSAGANVNIYVNIYSIAVGSWDGANAIETGDGSAASPAIASNGTGYGAAWFQYETGQGWSIFASIYSGTWSTPQLLESSIEYASQPSIATDGTNYAATWYQGVSPEFDIYASIHNGTAWSTAALIESGDGRSFRPLIVQKGTDYAASWRQIDSSGNSNIFASFYESSAWTDEEALAGTVYKGICQEYSAATDDEGRTVAVWQQYHNGRSYIYASMNSAGTWSTPAILAGDYLTNDDGYTPSLAVNSDTFMVVYNEDGEILARPFDGSSWGTETDLESDPDYSHGPVIGANETGFAVVWFQWNSSSSEYDVMANIYDGVSWGSAVKINTTAGDYMSAIKVVSNGNEYAASWIANLAGTEYIYSSIFNGTSWETESEIASTTNSFNLYALASDGDGYMVVWDEYNAPSRSIYANMHDGTSWSGESVIESGTGYAYNPTAASNGSGYLAAWYQDDAGNSIFANIYDGTSWAGEDTIETSTGFVETPMASSDGTGYGVVWPQQDAGIYNIYANTFNGSVWAGPVLLEFIDSDAYRPKIFSNGSKYSAIWQQYDITDPLSWDIYARLGF